MKNHRRIRTALLLGALLIFSHAHAGSDLQSIKSRDVLRCGVSDDIPGFSVKDSAGRWSGMNIDFCRALAAAVLGDANKVAFIPLTASRRFPALQSKAVDILLRNTTWTFSRESVLMLSFPAVLFYDGQGFMVSKAARIKSPEQLNGKSVCVEKGTTHEQHLSNYFAERNATVKTVVIDSALGAAQGLASGRCQAYSSDSSQLAAMRSQLPNGIKQFEILPQRISKEPMGPVIRNNDPEWATLVRWAVHFMVASEEFGITRQNVEARAQALRTANSPLFAGYGKMAALNLGIPADWGVRVIKTAGNYGELFDRHFGPNTPLAIERGQNHLWTKGGLMYAPPLD